METLLDKLTEYKDAGVYPFHMPGHKRVPLDFPNPYSIDITEIDGFDNLHHASEILKEAQERAAALYGSKRCFYLVNGSTCGLLAAICAVTEKKDKILVARNSHKAVYHGIFLQELEAEYLFPVITESGIQGQITRSQVKEALDKDESIKAVVITSPTYEGIISDVEGIAEEAHRHGIPLIVDAAHGAHLGFEENGLKNPVYLGADIVIMSLHKTLPSFTQTALLHVCSEYVSEDAVAAYLGIFETSSPSYLFMAGMDACICFLQKEKKRVFTQYRKLLDDFYAAVSDLEYLHVMRKEDLTREEAFAWDDGKLVIFSEKAGMTGEELHRKLLSEYRIQMEMVSGFYVLGMTSIMDSEEGFCRLSQALHDIDRNVAAIVDNRSEKIETGGKNAAFIRSVYKKNEKKCSMQEAGKLPSVEVSFDKAAGNVSADTISLYPPGIPMIVPGEVITADFLKKIEECQEMGLQVEGASGLSEKRIKIVYF